MGNRRRKQFPLAADVVDVRAYGPALNVAVRELRRRAGELERALNWTDAATAREAAAGLAELAERLGCQPPGANG